MTIFDFALAIVIVAGSTQDLPIGNVDFYSLHGIPEADVRKAIGIKAGDVVPDTAIEAMYAAAQRRLAMLPGVRRAHFELVCCEAWGRTLYVGLEHRAVAPLVLRDPPRGSIRLPDHLLALDEQFAAALTDALRRGVTGDDWSRGHSLMEDPAARAIQEQFARHATEHVSDLREVLRHAADERHRALAAQVLAYAPDKPAIVDDLAYASSDPSAEVRNNATRALWLLAEFTTRVPGRQIHIPAAPFVRMIGSPIWKDRNKGSLVLEVLTRSRDARLLQQLRRGSLEALIEIARWKSPGHAGPALHILGRMGGLSDEAIAAATSGGDRETVIRAARAR